MSTKLHEKKVGFIGGGNMAQALISGMVGSGMPSENIMVSDPNEVIQKKLAEDGIRIAANTDELIEYVDVIVLAIKPQLFSVVLPTLKGKLDKQLIISIAAGIPLVTISELLGYDTIIRSMPNTPALIRKGATGVYAGDTISEADKQLANDILAAAGLVVWVESEELIHAVTAVSGSAPAYFFYVMEAMIEEGKALGLTEEQAKQLTLQTALGASQMAVDMEESPATLREKVTSPNGTTHAAIESMKSDQLDSIIAKAMKQCVARSKEMMDDALSS